jgi:phosphoribosylformimino-5-aminoimidazole carboxamide ribotide isomerase
MLIFPAIDLYGGKAVRLYQGDYNQMTVYRDDPAAVAEDFVREGASCLHLVDLEGARVGHAVHVDTIRRIAQTTPLFTEVGGGIRTMAAIEQYLEAGASRVILGTAAVTDEGFAATAACEFGEQIAVGVDVRDGLVAIRGWQESSGLTARDFCRRMQDIGIRTIICTDISKDGAMQGTNHALYQELSGEFSMNLVASGGVSSIDDVKKLREAGLYGAIIGKAYYTGAISLKEAIEVAR